MQTFKRHTGGGLCTKWGGWWPSFMLPALLRRGRLLSTLIPSARWWPWPFTLWPWAAMMWPWPSLRRSGSVLWRSCPPLWRFCPLRLLIFLLVVFGWLAAFLARFHLRVVPLWVHLVFIVRISSRHSENFTFTFTSGAQYISHLSTNILICKKPWLITMILIVFLASSKPFCTFLHTLRRPKQLNT